MPKISNNRLRIEHKDIDKAFDVVVWYNKDHHFYAILPDEFFDVAHHLEDDERRSFGIVVNKKGYRVIEDKKWIVSGESEKECLKAMRHALINLMDKKLEQRNVIICFYDPDDTTNYNGHQYNQEHGQIGLKMALTYAVETSIGENKVYSVYKTYNRFGEDVEKRHEIRTWGMKHSIIPDTPENRATLEKLYSALKELNNKLSEFTSSPEKLLEMISSNIKLLN